MELINFLKEHDIATEEAISVPAYKRQYISEDGSIQWEEQTLQLMTSWDRGLIPALNKPIQFTPIE